MIDLLTLKLENGDELRGCRWEIAEPKAICVIMTGMVETSERYDAFAKYLCGLGCSVYCLDHYGQGRNCDREEQLGVWPHNGFQATIDLLRQEIEQVRRPDLPLYVFAHSMGSYVGQGFVQQYGSLADRVVLCGTCGKRGIAPIASALGKLRAATHDRDTYRDQFLSQLMFGPYNKRIEHPRTPFDWLSTDTENVDAYMADPKCGYVATSGFYADFLSGMTTLYRPEMLRKIPSTLPILLISGSEDPSTEYAKGTERLGQMYQSYGLNARVKVYPGLRHELLNEIGREQVYRDIAAFFTLTD